MKKQLLKRPLTIFAEAGLILALVTGCGGTGGSRAAMFDSELSKLASSDYPLKTKQTLKIWTERGGNIIGTHSDPLSYPSNMNYIEKLGVQLDWIFASQSQRDQEFNLMVASGDIPDIIGYYFANNGKDGLSGGPEKAIKDGWIAPMNDYIETYAPNYYRFLNENPRAMKEVKTDAGNIYFAPYYIVADDNQDFGATGGYLWRKDWLDELNLEVPETIDEWENALTQFKNKKGASAPFSLVEVNVDRGLSSAFGINLGWYHEGQTVHYGYSEEGYRDFLTTMNRWYTNGLIDPNFATATTTEVDANMINGKSGATMTWMSSIKKYYIGAKNANPDYSLVFSKFPVKNKGETPKFGMRDPNVYFGGWALGGTSDKKELAMKVIDFGYTEPGYEFLTFGTKGETYEINNDEYKYMDLISKNSEGLAQNEAISYYIQNSSIPSIYEKKLQDAKQRLIYTLPEEFRSQENLKNNEVNDYKLPYVTPTLEESSEYNRIQADIKKYVDEMRVKFITGKESLDHYDEYLAQLDSRGMSRLIEIMQSAYDRYTQR